MIKALTLTQPWATLVAVGAKRIETRSWSTNYRGPLAIHAAKLYPIWARDLASTEPIYSKLRSACPILPTTGEPPALPGLSLPVGCVVAIAQLIDCFEMTEEWIRLVGEQERAFGRYAPGRFAWILAGIEQLQKPIPARGSLGLWWWLDKHNSH